MNESNKCELTNEDVSNTSIIFTGKLLNKKSNFKEIKKDISIIINDSNNENKNFIYKNNILKTFESISSSEFSKDSIDLQNNNSGFVSSNQESSVRNRNIKIKDYNNKI